MRYFHNLTDDEKEKILGYKLMVYECMGTDTEKLDWFRTINIAGEKLTDQELRNAVYAGSWVTDAKKYFSKNGCVAYRMANKYLTGSAIRQDYLETAIEWIAGSKGNIKLYMAKHQHDKTANELWNYFQCVISWATAVFPKYRKEMKGVDWGFLYKNYHEQDNDPDKLEAEVAKLMADSDVTNKKGIYAYVFDHDERNLNIRTFDDNTKRSVYERQNGKCAICGKYFDIEDMHADHIVPWSKGGRTVEENCQLLCREDNLKKGAL